MTDASWKAFEKLNHRIARLVHRTGATVEWNGTIIDPDTGVSRQIDVLITSADGKRSSVECREHAEAQSVKWIEELIGRKMSLQLDGMIAVAFNGFYAPAAKKAASYGITLYDYDRLSDAEIASWGGVARVEAEFVAFDHLEIVAGVSQTDSARLAASTADPAFRFGELDAYGVLQASLQEAIAAHPGAPLQRQMDPAGFTLDGAPLTVLSCAYAGRLVTQFATCTYAALVDSPGTARDQRKVGVQRFEHTVHELVQHDGEAHLQVDVSSIHPPPNSILREMRVVFPQKTAVTRHELIGERRIHTAADQVALTIVATP